MKIGILSDTHGMFPTEIYRHFHACDELWHAGDIGSFQVVQKIAAFKPLRAVYGNIDTAEVRQHYPKAHHFTCAGLTICITHIAGPPPIYNVYTRGLIQRYNPDILVCGHTHILSIERYKPNLLHINPGAIGLHGIHPVRSLIRFEIIDNKPCHMEVIEFPR